MPRLIPVVVAALAVSACGSGDDSADSTPIADVTFEAPTYVTVPAEVAPTYLPPTTTTTSTTAAPAGGQTVTTSTTTPCPTKYEIQQGDTSRIGVAKQFGLTYQQLDAANVSTPGYENFVVGTEIVVPCPTDG